MSRPLFVIFYEVKENINGNIERVIVMSNDNLNIDRINELAKKKKEQGLTEAELKSNRNYVKIPRSI